MAGKSRLQALLERSLRNLSVDIKDRYQRKYLETERPGFCHQVDFVLRLQKCVSLESMAPGARC